MRVLVASLVSLLAVSTLPDCKKKEPSTTPPTSAPLLPAATTKPVRIGDAVPATKVTTHEGKTLSLQDLKGKMFLLWFYPAAATPGCTTEGISLRERFEEFKKRNVQILGASVDSPEKNAAFAKDNSFPFPLLSDTERGLALSFGAVDSKDAKYTRRISVLVDESGVVKKIYAKVVPAEHAAEVLADIDALRKK